MTLEKYDYKGCGNCPLSKEDRGSCIENHSVNLKIKIIRPVSWEGWGGFIPVFNVGDVINAEGVVKDGVLYCVSAESTIHPGVKDYIMLDAVGILEAIVNG